MFLLGTTTACSRVLHSHLPRVATASFTTKTQHGARMTAGVRGRAVKRIAAFCFGVGGIGGCLAATSPTTPRFIRGGATPDSMARPLTSSLIPTRLMATASCEGAKPPTKVKVALCQILVGDDKEANIKTAREAITKAAATGAKIVALPECWNSPYSTGSFPQYAESITPDLKCTPSVKMLVDTAKALGIYLIGGSIPERDNGKIYNTCVIVGPDGKILAKHRKVHLFDIDVPGRITFKESDTLTAGDTVTVVDTPYGKIGIGICYDIRFAELWFVDARQLSMLMRMRGCKILIYPGAFNLTTGPAHWELLQRARAVDNQLFVAAVSPARNPVSSYQAWGHTSVVNPWGEVIASTGHEPAMVTADLDLSQVEEVRKNIPTSHQRREDIYHVVDKQK